MSDDHYFEENAEWLERMRQEELARIAAFGHSTTPGGKILESFFLNWPRLVEMERLLNLDKELLLQRRLAGRFVPQMPFCEKTSRRRGDD